jgi:hypothetical protein
MDLKEYARELTRTKREIAVAVNKPEHLLQPKNIHEQPHPDDPSKTIWVGHCYITSVRNRDKRTYGDTDAQGNYRGPNVIAASVNIAAKNIVDGTAVLSSDEDITFHNAQAKKMREAIEIAESTKQPINLGMVKV